MQNNPIRFNDPTGHMRDDGATGGCNASTCDYVPPVVTPQPGSDIENVNGGIDDELDPNNMNDPDFHWGIGNQDCDLACQNTLEGLFVFGTTMDSLATGLNFRFALAADVAFLINPLLYPEALILYQPLSIIPNLIGSVGGVTWIVSGFISGENSFEITMDDGLIDVSGSIAQDTIATVIFDGFGWLARDPNIAFSINGAGTTYDILRNPFDPILPTFFQPSYSFTIDLN